MSAIEIRNSLGDSVFKAVVGGVMGVAGVVLIWMGVGLPDGRLLCAGPFVALCGLVMAFFGVRDLATRKPQITLADSGLLIPQISPEVIPWNNIQATNVVFVPKKGSASANLTIQFIDANLSERTETIDVIDLEVEYAKLHRMIREHAGLPAEIAADQL